MNIGKEINSISIMALCQYLHLTNLCHDHKNSSDMYYIYSNIKYY